AASLAAGLAACSPGQSPAPTAGGPAAATPIAGTTPAPAELSGSITWITEAAADIQPVIKDIIAKFQAKYPNVKVVQKTSAGGGIAGGWSTYIDTIVTQIAGGDIPDVIWISTEPFRPFTARGLFEPLESYIDRDKAELQ